MEMNFDVYEKFLAKVQSFIDKSEFEKLKESDLIKLAKSLGMNEEDWDFVESKFQETITRGRNHLKFKNYDLAIEALSKAILIKPLDKDSLVLLAKAFLYEWKFKKDELACSQAILIAGRIIDFYPENQEAYWVIQQCRQSKTFNQKQSNFLILVLIIVLAIPVYFFFQNKNVQDIQENAPVISKDIHLHNETKTLYLKPEVLVIQTNDFDSSLFHFAVENAQVEDYSNSYSLTFAADLTLNSVEIKKLALNVFIFSSNDSLISRQEIDVLRYHAAARPGDVFPIRFLYFDSTAVELPLKVKLSVLDIEKRPALSHYAQSKEVKLENDSLFKDFSLEIRQRSNVFTHSEILKQSTQTLNLEVLNNGENYIDKLRIKIKWFSISGKLLAQKSVWVNISNYPAIKKGQRRILSVIQSFDLGITSGAIQYKVYLEQIELFYVNFK